MTQVLELCCTDGHFSWSKETTKPYSILTLVSICRYARSWPFHPTSAPPGPSAPWRRPSQSSSRLILNRHLPWKGKLTWDVPSAPSGLGHVLLVLSFLQAFFDAVKYAVKFYVVSLCSFYSINRHICHSFGEFCLLIIANCRAVSGQCIYSGLEWGSACNSYFFLSRDIFHEFSTSLVMFFINTPFLWLSEI